MVLTQAFDCLSSQGKQSHFSLFFFWSNISVQYDESGQSYWYNMIKTLDDHCTLTPFAFKEPSNCVITHTHGWSLRDYMVEVWWTDSRHGWRMGDWMRAFLKELILGLMTIVRKMIMFTPTLDNVVFDIESTDDPSMFPSTPKFRRMWDDTREFNPTVIWNSLAELVQELIKETIQRCGDFELHPDVQHFLDMLKYDCKGANFGKMMVKHPSLMTIREILDFIVEFRDKSHKGEVVTLRVKPNKFSNEHKITGKWDAGVDDWKAVVKQDGRMNEVLTAWENDIKDPGRLRKKDDFDIRTLTKPVKLAYFIRNVYHHINTQKLIHHYGGVYYYDRLADDLYDAFPKLAIYLFMCCVKKGESHFM